jgi:hypothetical protein
MSIDEKERKHLGRFSRHILSQLVCMGRHTITNLMTTSGRQFMDWSADYRLYGKERIDCEQLFAHICKEVIRLNGKGPLVTALDDSLLRKTGKKIPGVKYARDPMGPPFRVNFVRGQRVIQMSAALSDGLQARMIPVIFRDASTPDKPKRSAAEEEWTVYREECKKRRLSVHGVSCINDLRNRMDRNQDLWITVDGSYTNRTVLKSLPESTVLIGRIRADAKLYHLPSPFPGGAGRKRIYGSEAPTPDEIRMDDTILWQNINAYTSGALHEFRVKTVRPLRWRATGKEQIVQIMVIAPLRYRLSKKGPLLYRQPAYLICTDPELPPEKILQAYLWRWDIEINFRDEKNLLGTGQAEVRNPSSVKAVPQMMVASYALLLLAGIHNWGITGIPQPQNIPKWQNPNKKYRASTNDLIKQLRYELWADSIGSINLSHFDQCRADKRSPLNPVLPAFDAILQVNSA